MLLLFYKIITILEFTGKSPKATFTMSMPDDNEQLMHYIFAFS